MLKRFEVENFKGFKNPLVMDFTAREYEFNKNLIVNGIVNKAIVYGKNGVGKSCLGIAIFDIVWHLTDKERMQLKYLLNYLNLESNSSNAKFKYSLQLHFLPVQYYQPVSSNKALNPPNRNYAKFRTMCFRIPGKKKMRCLSNKHRNMGNTSFFITLPFQFYLNPFNRVLFQI